MGVIEIAGAGYAAPTPSEALEASLRQHLKSIDGLLDLKWVPTAYWNARHMRWEGRYALTCDWPQADKRWEMVQQGEVDPALAHDIIGWLCSDMTDPQSIPATLDGVMDRVMEALGRMDNTRYPWKQRFASTVEKNRKRHLAMRAEVADMTHDVASYYYNQVKGNPIVPGADFKEAT